MFDDFRWFSDDNIKLAEQKTLYHIKAYLKRCTLPKILTLSSLGLLKVASKNNDNNNAIFKNVPTTINKFVQMIQDQKNSQTFLPPPTNTQDLNIKQAIAKLNKDQIVVYNAIVSAL